MRLLRAVTLSSIVSISAVTAPALAETGAAPANRVSGEECRPRDADRPAVGLVLGGGGARGSAHIGVIRRLEELRIPVDCVVGTSMGSLVGALYATGMSSDELEAVITGVDWDAIFNDATPREDLPFRRKRDDSFALFGPKVGIGKDSSVISTGAVSGQRISFLFESIVSERTRESRFSDLPIPFQAIGADIVTGERVVMNEGNLASAMRASMSVPGVFDPVRRDGHLLVDGGIVDNLPVQAARDMGADVVIAVDVGAGLTKEENLKNVLSIVGQLLNLMFASNVEASRRTLTADDLLIKPPLADDFSSASFKRSTEGVAAGYEGALALSDSLRRYALSEGDYAAYVASLPVPSTGTPTIDFVRLDNRSRFSDAVILHRLDVAPGEPLDVERLARDIETIYGLGFLDLVTYRIVEEDGRRGLELAVSQDARGTQFIEWGLDLFSDSIEEGFNLRLGYLKTDIDELGSEMRVLGQLGRDPALIFDLWKYLDSTSKWFVVPQLFAQTQRLTFFEDNDARSVFEVNTYGANAAIGREFSRHSALLAGFRAFNGEIETLIGPPDIGPLDFQGRELFLTYTFDRLDDRYIPGDGLLLNLSSNHARESIGGDADYDQLFATGVVARTFRDRHTLVGLMDLRTTIDAGAPVYAAPRGGGLFRLSGFYDNEIAGDNFGVVSASYQYKVSGGALLPTRIGASLEYGSAAADFEDVFGHGVVHGSLFLAYRSPIGPAYLGVGLGEGGQRRLFVSFGNVFNRTTVLR